VYINMNKVIIISIICIILYDLYNCDTIEGIELSELSEIVKLISDQDNKITPTPSPTTSVVMLGSELPDEEDYLNSESDSPNSPETETDSIINIKYIKDSQKIIKLEARIKKNENATDDNISETTGSKLSTCIIS